LTRWNRPKSYGTADFRNTGKLRPVTKQCPWIGAAALLYDTKLPPQREFILNAPILGDLTVLDPVDADDLISDALVRGVNTEVRPAMCS
jgi:hypothetical protein